MQDLLFQGYIQANNAIDLSHLQNLLDAKWVSIRDRHEHAFGILLRICVTHAGSNTSLELHQLQWRSPAETPLALQVVARPSAGESASSWPFRPGAPSLESSLDSCIADGLQTSALPTAGRPVLRRHSKQRPLSDSDGRKYADRLFLRGLSACSCPNSGCKHI